MKRLALAASLFAATLLANANQFDAHTMWLAHMKLSSHFDYRANVDTYMKTQRRDVWRAYRNDEFELEAKRAETIEIMKERVDALDLHQDFEINTSVELGSYDFDAQEYPLKGPGRNSYYTCSMQRLFVMPPSFLYCRVFFTNPEILGPLKMAKEEAKAFLSSRKDRYGQVERDLPARIRFRVHSTHNDPGEFMATITSIDVFADRDHARKLASF